MEPIERDVNSFRRRTHQGARDESVPSWENHHVADNRIRHGTKCINQHCIGFDIGYKGLGYLELSLLRDDFPFVQNDFRQLRDIRI